MPNQPLDLIPIPVLYVLSAGVLLIAMECGFRLNRQVRKSAAKQSDAHVGVVTAASLALLGFLLAFVVSLGTDVFKQRWQLIVAEVNAISTTHLRAGFLAEPQRSASRQLLEEYVSARTMAWEPGQLDEALQRSIRIHAELWRHAEAVATAQPSPTTSLYISALNEVLDRHTERVAYGLNIRIPPTIVWSLYLVAGLSAFLVGMLTRDSSERNPLAVVILSLILAAVLLLIVDLDRPSEGFLKVPHQPMHDLDQQLSGSG
ncbi:MAG: hypothetical protein ACLFSC_06835 [Wenzhouxiangella sp.]